MKKSIFIFLAALVLAAAFASGNTAGNFVEASMISNKLIRLLIAIMLLLILYRQMKELARQKKELEQKNKEIDDSLCAAKRIQEATLPAKEYWESVFREHHFIYYKPFGNVGGDFYWIDRRDDHIIVAVADCTGHGVPGALLSMLGISTLHKIAGKMEEPKADKILNELRDEIIRLLNPMGKMDELRHEGMDIALLVIHKQLHKIEFSGANNPLWLVRVNEGQPQLIEIKADRMPIGIYPDQEKTFSSFFFDYQSGDSIYLFSDGYADQFGCANKGKFKARKFKNLLCNINARPMKEQANILDKTHLEWIGDEKQTDDILVVGIKL
jgi:serine phosphatase RsbU (regulator of sigma subunit)